MTPFEGGRVDLDAFAALVERQAREGSHGVLVAGTTAEATSLTPAERGDLFRTAVEVSARRLPVVAGTGSASYDETVELTAHFHNTRGQGLANVYAALEERPGLVAGWQGGLGAQPSTDDVICPAGQAPGGCVVARRSLRTRGTLSPFWPGPRRIR